MIRVIIYDDDFPTTLKDMAVTVDPEKFQGVRMTIRGTVSKLDEEVRKQTKELLDSWWSHRNCTADEFYGDEDNEKQTQLSLPLMVAFDSNAHKPGAEDKIEAAIRATEKSA